MAKFENIRAYNFQNAVRASHNHDKSWNETDSKFGLCKLNDVPELIKKKFKLYGITDYNEHDIILQYRNVIIWNFESMFVEYAIIGPEDLELLKDNLDKIFVSYDANIDGNIATYVVNYKELKHIYEIEKDGDNLILNMIKDLPYAQDLLINN